MKKLITYYLIILFPLIVLFWLIKTETISSGIFVFWLFFYVFIYRTYIDGKKLSDKHLIPEKDIWKMIIPGSRFKYFKELYLK